MDEHKQINFRCPTKLYGIIHARTKIGEFGKTTVSAVVINLLEKGIVAQDKEDRALERALKRQSVKDEAEDGDLWKWVKDNWRESIEDPVVNEMMGEALDALEKEHGREHVDTKLKDLGLR